MLIAILILTSINTVVLGLCMVALCMTDNEIEQIKTSLDIVTKKPRVRLPWESDGSNFNVAKPGGDYPDQM